MAQEVWTEGRHNEVYSPATDVYSLAITLWEVITQKQPFREATLLQDGATVIEAPYTLPLAQMQQLCVKIHDKKKPLRPPLSPNKFPTTIHSRSTIEPVIELIQRAWSADSKERPTVENIAMTLQRALKTLDNDLTTSFRQKCLISKL